MKKNVLKLISTTICLITLLTTNAFAISNNVQKVDEIKKQLLENDIKVEYIKKIGSKNAIKSFNGKELIEVNSIDEMKSVIEELKKFDKESNQIDISNDRKAYSNVKGLAKNTLRSGTGSGTASKWAPLFGVACWKNITFPFTYEYYSLAGYHIYTGVDENFMESNLSGLSVAIDWTQTGSSSTLTSDKRKVKLKANGYYTIGFKFEDLEVGANVNGTFKITSKKVSDYEDVEDIN